MSNIKGKKLVKANKSTKFNVFLFHILFVYIVTIENINFKMDLETTKFNT